MMADTYTRLASDLERRLLADGWRFGRPLHVPAKCVADDVRIYESEPCAECGGEVKATPMRRARRYLAVDGGFLNAREAEGYLVLCRCAKCGAGFEG